MYVCVKLKEEQVADIARVDIYFRWQKKRTTLVSIL